MKVNIGVIAVCLLCVFGVFYYANTSRDKSVDPIAEKALNLMYTFQTPEELDLNMEGLKHLVSDEVYRQLTIDKTERVLNIYLKFNNKPSVVHVVSAEEGLITYNLESESIASSRLFMFKYEMDDGIIVDLFEAEIIPFPNTIGE